jgi:UDP-N-acetylglucosamine diphosphorylase / glucose-1-phosphate thymidylyltransferase / UDP-N-acetylgalactosamine diphosphorylase / glucosamine-1-phosphate N-acetyltransferase / galactosamine-1-phosphate N-acetyltransferase
MNLNVSEVYWNMKAVILAAGQGVRLLPLTENKPKPMVDVASKPILQWIIERAITAGVTEIGIIVGFKQDVIRNHFGIEWNGIPITYFEQTEHLGTGNAIEMGKEFCGQAVFLSLNGDIIPETKLLKELIAAPPADCVLVARKDPEPWKYGIVELKGEKVVSLIEKPSKKESNGKWVNAGLYKFSPAIFEAINQTQMSERNEFEITDAITILTKQGNVSSLQWTGNIIDIGSADDLNAAEKQLQ